MVACSAGFVCVRSEEVEERSIEGMTVDARRFHFGLFEPIDAAVQA